MRKLSIDRFEGNYAICEDGERKMFAIELGEAAQGAPGGDILVISDEGKSPLTPKRPNAGEKKSKSSRTACGE